MSCPPGFAKDGTEATICYNVDYGGLVKDSLDEEDLQGPLISSNRRRHKCSVESQVIRAISVSYHERGTMNQFISPGDLHTQLSGEHPPVVIDVRGVEAYRAGHIAGAAHHRPAP